MDHLAELCRRGPRRLGPTNGAPGPRRLCPARRRGPAGWGPPSARARSRAPARRVGDADADGPPRTELVVPGYGVTVPPGAAGRVDAAPAGGPVAYRGVARSSAQQATFAGRLGRDRV